MKVQGVLSSESLQFQEQVAQAVGCTNLLASGDLKVQKRHLKLQWV